MKIYQANMGIKTENMFSDDPNIEFLSWFFCVAQNIQIFQKYALDLSFSLVKSSWHLLPWRFRGPFCDY